MLATIRNNTRQAIPKRHLERAFSLLEEKISGLKKKEITLIFVGDRKIRTLNRTYRGKNSITDVLSFDLGDIFINPLEARRQSRSYKREIILLAVHGALHIAGYDHDTPGKRKRMFSVQESVLNEVFEERNWRLETRD